MYNLTVLYNIIYSGMSVQTESTSLNGTLPASVFVSDFHGNNLTY